MSYQVIDNEGRLLDALVDVDEGGITLHSRGGGGRNPDYSTALRLLLQRLVKERIQVSGAWVDSSSVQTMPLSERTVLSSSELGTDSEVTFRLLSSRMVRIGQSDTARGGNATKKLRIGFRSPIPEVPRILGLHQVRKDTRSAERLPASELRRVTASHVWQALDALRAGATHDFGPSTDFDLITDENERFPPKAAFGVAASLALGRPIKPKHFSGGYGTVCFDILERSGFLIVPKDAPLPAKADALSAWDLAWAEGRLKLVTHLKRERSSGLAQAKKADFRSKNGRLFCERCGFDPIEKYGEAGEACIEVHHSFTTVAEMSETHTTRLDDVQCLCANCHRVVHAEMRARAIA